MSCRILGFFSAVLLVTTSQADDWPQWLGPQRDGVWREAGVIDNLPSEGLPITWRAKVAKGYAGPAVADGKVFLFDYVVASGKVGNLPSRRDNLTGQERLIALDAATGDVLWQESYSRDYAISYGGGPRCTPTVDGDRVYTLGAEGDLVCRRTSDGQIVWQKNFKQEFGVDTPIWGHSAHPLVAGDLVHCVAGGQGSVAVAFDKHTGEEKWRALSAGEPGYCPPTMINHAGADQLLIWHPESLNSLNPKTGILNWSLPARPSYGMSLHAPQKLGDKLFISAIGNLSVLMQLNADGSDVDVLWSASPKSGLRSVNVTPHLEPGVIYGVDCETSEMMAVSMDDGHRMWTTKQPTIGDTRARHGTTFIIKHEPSGNYWLFNDSGELISAKLSPEKFEETGRMKILEPTSDSFGRPVVWSHPAFAGKCVYARNDEELVCVSLTADSQP